MPRNSKRTGSGQRPKEHDRERRRKRGRDYHVSVRGELRKEPDVHKIARVVVALAMAQAEADAERDRAEDVVEADTEPEVADE